jgi:hypothetical protein
MSSPDSDAEMLAAVDVLLERAPADVGAELAASRPEKLTSRPPARKEPR